MTALREFVTVKNHQVIVNLPIDFKEQEVEIIILPKRDKESFNSWSEEELEDIGKIGFLSDSFEDDDEDYAKW